MLSRKGMIWSVKGGGSRQKTQTENHLALKRRGFVVPDEETEPLNDSVLLVGGSVGQKRRKEGIWNEN